MPFWKITSMSNGNFSAKNIEVDPYQMYDFINQAQNQNGYTPLETIVSMKMLMEVPDNQTVLHPNQQQNA
jgi:hypothetical protein